MHGTARAPGYPSDSTRSLAGVGPLGELPGAACTTFARGQRGRRSVTYAPRALLAGWAGAGRARRPPPLTARTNAAGSATSGGEVAGRLIRFPPLRTSSAAALGPRGAGAGAAVRARAGYAGGHPGTTRSLTLAGVGQCSLADGLGRQTGRPRSSGSSARIATGGPGTLSGGGSSRCCRWRIAVGAVYPRDREAVQPGPLVRRQLGGLSAPDRQRRAAATAAGTPGRARPVSIRMHPRGWPEDGISTALPCLVAGRAGAAPADRSRACVQHALLLTKRRGQRPDDPASGSVTRPVALSPRIGRNMGRWLQSQSESGWPDHGPNGDHGRRAEPGASHVPITAGAASRQVQTCTSSNSP